MHDYSGHEEEASQDQLDLLHRLADKLDVADAAVERMEAELKEAKERARQIRENDMPELMLSLGVKEYTSLSTGVKFKLREEVRASFFVKDHSKREPAFEWLRANGHEGLIKNTLTASFGKDQEAMADRFAEFVAKFDGPVDMSRKKDIHHQTMLAFLREQLREGENVPLELFGATIQKIVDVKRPK